LFAVEVGCEVAVLLGADAVAELSPCANTWNANRDRAGMTLEVHRI
jgi:hypothetical protein